VNTPEIGDMASVSPQVLSGQVANAMHRQLPPVAATSTEDVRSAHHDWIESGRAVGERAE
jgi:hypothetical protein